ncbi:MAG: hypothetical protein AB7F19_07500 [Candidatus Babeliales bacterium]
MNAKQSHVMLPAIVSDSATDLRSLIADDVMTFGHAAAAKLCKKNRKLCFTLAYWLIFGQAPRKLNAPPTAR